MGQKISRLGWAVCVVVLSLGALARGQVYESTRELVPTLEAPQEARGVFVDTLFLAPGFSQHDVEIVVSGLEAGTYDLDVGAQSFTFTVGGATNTVFTRTDVSINTVDALITVSQGDVILLRTIGTGPQDLETSGSDLFEKSKGKGKLLGTTKAKAKIQFKTVNKVNPEKKYEAAYLAFTFRKLEPSSDFVLVGNGWPIASFSSNTSGVALVVFTNEPISGDNILTFDPTETDYEVRPEGETTPIMTGRMTGPAILGNLERINGLNYLMASTGVDNDATGRALMLGSSPANVTELELTVELLAQGEYDVMVDDVVMGTLTTDSNGDGVVVFSTTPNGTEQDLSLPIVNTLIRIVNADNKVVLGRTLFVAE